MKRTFYILLVLLVCVVAFSSHGSGQTLTLRTMARRGDGRYKQSNNTQGVQPMQSVTVDQLLTMLRFPAETRSWVPMLENKAYFRDVFTGGETYSSGAADGDTLTAKIFDAKGNPLGTWPGFTFHSTYSYGGQTYQNCWVSTSMFGSTDVLCNTEDIEVIWYQQSQCVDGAFTMRFYRNTLEFAHRDFTLLPYIEPGAVQEFGQGDSAWAGTHYDFWCYTIGADGKKHGTECPAYGPYPAGVYPYTIQNKGCFLSSAANVLEYHGVANLTPPILNDGLDAPGTDELPLGYRAGNVLSPGVATYARSQGVNLDFGDRIAFPDLVRNICSYGPQLMGVKCVNRHGRLSPGHWVTVYGLTDDKSSWKIKDPAHGNDTTLADYGNTYCATHVFIGPEYSFQVDPRLTITFHSPVELLITDPQGRRLGDDPLTQQSYNEIPGGFYESAGLTDDVTGEEDADPPKLMYVPAPVAGDYVVTVTGTAEANYSADFEGSDASDNSTLTSLAGIPITLNAVQKFTISYTGAAGESLDLGGGFDGGGQRPRDVNRFLTYANPSDSPVTLPAGTTSFPLVLFYGRTTIPSTFAADLNGNNITALFHPAAGTGESVQLALQPGRNVLKLSIDGNLSRRVATDTDRLVFSVQ